MVSATVSAKGQLQVSSGGVASATNLLSGGTDVVFGGGSAVSTTINSASVETVFSGGTVVSTQVQGGGSRIAVPGATGGFLFHPGQKSVIQTYG